MLPFFPLTASSLLPAPTLGLHHTIVCVHGCLNKFPFEFIFTAKFISAIDARNSTFVTYENS